MLQRQADIIPVGPARVPVQWALARDHPRAGLPHAAEEPRAALLPHVRAGRAALPRRRGRLLLLYSDAGGEGLLASGWHEILFFIYFFLFDRYRS